jgi:hypothetical protein
MVRISGVAVVCAVAAFAAAFFAAGAGQMAARHIAHHKLAPFADTAASGVAVSFSGAPAALKLPPPPPKHVKHHAKPAATVPATPATTSAPATPAPVVSAPARHKSSGNDSGHGVTIVGP